MDRKRPPPIPAIVHALEAAGFRAPIVDDRAYVRRLTTAEQLDRVRHRYLSTFDLLPPGEYERGLRFLETEMPRRYGDRFEISAPFTFVRATTERSPNPRKACRSPGSSDPYPRVFRRRTSRMQDFHREGRGPGYVRVRGPPSSRHVRRVCPCPLPQTATGRRPPIARGGPRDRRLTSVRAPGR